MNDNPTETCPEVATPKHLFTTANARLMAAKSVAVRQERKANAIRIAESMTLASLIPPGKTIQTDDFAQRRLMRVREQLDRLDRLASEEDDPKRLKEFADATTRLSEQERILSGRPLPGSRRPAADRKPSAQVWSDPVPIAPTNPEG